MPEGKCGGECVGTAAFVYGFSPLRLIVDNFEMRLNDVASGCSLSKDNSI